MTNSSLSWGDLYHPTLVLLYNYFHYVTLILTTFLTIFASFVVYKKSPVTMSFYKYIILNSIWCNYVLDLAYFIVRPVFLFPYLVFYSHGWLKNINPGYIFHVYYGFLFIFIWMYASWVPALLYRISQVFPGTKFFEMFNNPKRYLVVFVGVLFYMEVIFTIPFVGFIYEPYNSTEAINSIISEEPAYSNFTLLSPPTLFSGCDYTHQCRLFLKLSPPCIVLLVITLGLVVWIGMPIYMYKAKSLKQTSSKKITQLNITLFFTLLVQIMMIQFTWVNLFWIFGGLIIFRVKNGSLIALIYSFVPLFYPILEISALIYFIKPYRVYVEKLVYGKFRKEILATPAQNLTMTNASKLVFNSSKKFS